MKGRVLAIDYGEKRIGLAISDPMRILATGLQTLQEGERAARIRIAELVQERSVTEIVVGLPLGLDGHPSAKTGKVLSFIDALKAEVEVPIQTIDERFTTAMAKKMLPELELKKKRRTKSKLDELAAVVILRSYLDGSSGQF